MRSYTATFSSFFVFCYLIKHKGIFSCLNFLKLFWVKPEGNEWHVNTLSPAKGGTVHAASAALD
jgi:hypothetical protein